MPSSSSSSSPPSSSPSPVPSPLTLGELHEKEQEILHTVSRRESAAVNSAQIVSSQAVPSASQRGAARETQEMRHVREKRYLERCRGVWRVLDGMGRGNVKHMVQHSADPMVLCRAIIGAAPLGNAKGMGVRRTVVEILVAITHEHSVPPPPLRGDRDRNGGGGGNMGHGQAKALIEFVAQQIGTLQEKDVAQIAWNVVSLLTELSADESETAGQGMGDQSAELPVFDLLVTCLNVVGSCEEVEHRDSGSASRTTRVTGQKFKRTVIERLCGMNWPSRYINSFAIAFKEIAMDEEEFQLVCNKLFACADRLKSSDLATFIHHVLVISHKGNKTHVLKQTVKKYGDVFTELLDEGDDNSKATATDILYHLGLTCMKDQQIGKTFLKLVKEGQIMVNQFAIGFMMVLAKIPALKKPVFTTIAKLIHEYTMFSNHVPLCWAEDEYQWVLSNVEKHLMQVVESLRGNREYICGELTDLSFFLIDSKPKDAKVPIAEEKLIVHPVDGSKVGQSIVQELFRHESPELRNYIMNELLTRIVAGSGHTQPNKYLRLLKEIIASNPVLWRDYESKFNDTVEYLTLLPQDVAGGLLDAMKPLFEIDPRLPDRIIKILRKSLFSTDQSSRVIAIEGLFAILHGVAISSENSMIAPEVDLERRISMEVELLGLMKRGLTLQFEVRKQLYEGYVQIAERKPHLREVIFRHLSEQLNRYYTESPRSFINFNAVIDEARLIVLEPAAHLLFCCQRCVVKFGQSININTNDSVDDVDEDDVDEDLIDDVNEDGSTKTYVISHSAARHLRDIAEKLEAIREALESEGTLPLFGFEKNSDYSPDTEDGKENLLRAYITLGVHLSVLEYTVMTTVTKREHVRARDEAVASMEKIFQSFIDLRETVSKRSRSSKKQRGSDGSNRSSGRASSTSSSTTITERLYIPFPSVDFVADMIKLVIAVDGEAEGGEGDDNDDDDHTSELLLDSRFFSFISQLSRAQVTFVKNQCEKVSSMDTLIAPLGNLCNALIRVSLYISENFNDKDGSSRKNRKKSIKSSADVANELILECVDIIARGSGNESDVLRLIQCMLVESTDASPTSSLSVLLGHLHDMMNRGSSLRIAFGLLIRISTLPSFNKKLHATNLRWVKGKDTDSTYVMENCVDPHIASTFFDMLFRYCAMNKRFERVEALCATIAQYATGGGQSNYIIPDSAESSALESSVSILQKLLDNILWKQSVLEMLSKLREQQKVSPSEYLSRQVREGLRPREDTLMTQEDVSSGTQQQSSPLTTHVSDEEEQLQTIMDGEMLIVYSRLAVGRRIFEHMFEIPRYTKGCDKIADAFLSFMSLMRGIAKQKTEAYVAEEKRLKKLHSTAKKDDPVLKPSRNFGDAFEILVKDTNILVQLFDDFVSNVSSDLEKLPKSALQRWERIHPEVDAAVNEYERHTSTLSKKTGVNLLENAKARVTDNVKVVFNMVKTEENAPSQSPISSSSTTSSSRSGNRSHGRSTRVRRRETEEDVHLDEEDEESPPRRKKTKRRKS